MKLLITGASGFLGSQVLPLLDPTKYEIHILTRSVSGLHSGMHEHRADLLAQEGIDLIAKLRPTHLLHFAWSVPPGKFWTSPENVRWLQASLDLFRKFADCGGKRWVGAGTCAEYDWSTGGVFNESHLPRPDTLYGACKSSLHATAQLWGEQLGVEVCWGRIFFPYGPNEPDGRLIPSVIRSLLSGKEAHCSEGLQVRDFVFSRDVARYFVGLIENSVLGPVNIGSGTPVSVRNVVKEIAEIIGRPDLLRFGTIPPRHGEPPQIIADIGRLQSLDLKPSVSLRDGLLHSVAWWKEHGGYN